MKSTCCSAPVEEECICSEWDGKGQSVCGFPCPIHNKNKDMENGNTMISQSSPILDKNRKRIMKLVWNKLQEENEDALHAPWVDAGRVCIALGWTLVWFWFGLTIGARI